MAVDGEQIAEVEETPAEVVVTVPVSRETESAEVTEGDGGTIVVVESGDGGGSGESVDHQLDRAREESEWRAAVERRLGEVENRAWSSVTHEEVLDVVEAVTPTVEEVAEVAAAEDGDDSPTDAESSGDESPHKTHWLNRSWSEWRGRR